MQLNNTEQSWPFSKCFFHTLQGAITQLFVDTIFSHWAQRKTLLMYSAVQVQLTL